MADSRPNQAFKAAPKRQSQILSITTTFGVLKMAQDSRQETRTEAAFICSARLLSSCFFFFSPIQYFHYASKTYHEKKAVWEEALENYRSSLLCLHYYCRLLAKHYFFSFHNARPTVEEKTYIFLTSTYNCKTRNLLFDFSFHFVFNLHFVGLIYIFFCLDVYI